MATESSDYQCLSQQLPQLPAFNDTQWLESAIQGSDMELMSSACDIAPTPFLLYVVHCCSADIALQT